MWETRARLEATLGRIASEPRLHGSRYRPEQSLHRASFNAIVSGGGKHFDAPAALVVEANLSRRALEQTVGNAAKGFLPNGFLFKPAQRNQIGQSNNQSFGNLNNNRFAPQPRSPPGASPPEIQGRPSSASSVGGVSRSNVSTRAPEASQTGPPPRVDSKPSTPSGRQQELKMSGMTHPAMTQKPKSYKAPVVPDKPADQFNDMLYAKPMRKPPEKFKPPPRNSNRTRQA